MIYFSLESAALLCFLWTGQLPQLGPHFYYKTFMGLIDFHNVHYFISMLFFQGVCKPGYKTFLGIWASTWLVLAKGEKKPTNHHNIFSGFLLLVQLYVLSRTLKDEVRITPFVCFSALCLTILRAAGSHRSSQVSIREVPHKYNQILLFLFITECVALLIAGVNVARRARLLKPSKTS